MEQEDVGLALGLALGDVSAGDHRRRREPSPLPAGPRAVGPSLTLGLPAGAVVKRERAEEAGDEGDMLSSYSAATRAGEMPDDEDGGGNRKKLRLSKEQSALLEDRFKEHSTLNPKQKAALAKQLNLRPRQVEVWFQNRRARTKLKQTEVDYELLKRCCETLTEENRRLHRELQQLRALHRTTPAPPHLYMQFPAATLSICPSCECITPSAADGPKKAAAAPPPPGRAHFFSPFTNSAAC